MAVQWGLSRKISACFGPSGAKSCCLLVGCISGAAPPCSGGQGFFSSALCLPVPQIGVSKLETTLVDSSELFLCLKVDEKSRFQILRNWGEACFLSDVFGAWKDPPLSPVALSQR
jgi:hypothetical protein